MFGLDFFEVESFILNYGDLLFVSSKQIAELIGYLSKELCFSDNEIVTTLRCYPEFIKKTKDDIKAIQRVLMHKAGMSTANVKSIILSFPRVVKILPEKITSVWNKLYASGLFVRLDIKKLILSHPTIINEDLKIIAENILNLSRIFELKDKKSIIKFLRECPRMVVSKNLKSKLVFLDTQNITLRSIMITPYILNQNQNILAAKHAVLSPFGLDFHLDSVNDIDFCVLISRVKFLGLSHLSLDSISMTESEFEKTFKIKSSTLTQTHMVSKRELSNLIHTKSNNSNIKCLIAKMFKNDFSRDLKIISNTLQKTNKINSDEARKEAIFSILDTLGVEKDIARDISKNLPLFVSANSVASTIEIFVNAGISREQIINIIEKLPSILAAQNNMLSNELAEHAVWIEAHRYNISNYVL